MQDLSNETMVHVKKEKVQYLQFRALLEYQDKVQHAYTIKKSEQNYAALYQALDLKLEGLRQIEQQAHSNRVEIVEEKEQIYTNIDGLLTNQKGISLILRFADCTPILFYDPKKNVIGNIHSGWRGTVQKIAQKGAIQLLKKYDCKVENLLCFLGPCIAQCHFEVGKEVKEIFEATFSYLGNLEPIIKRKEETEEEKYFIDTTAINRKLLEEMGILPKHIIQSNICTVCHAEQLHSYRAQKEKAGRNIALIALKEK